MARFRDQPLMWLFLIATACLNGVLAKAGLYGDDYDDLAVGFLIGQMFVAGSWVVGGRTHRLARAGVFVLAVLALATVICFAATPPPANGVTLKEWGEILGVVIVFSGLPAVAAGIYNFVAWRVRVHRRRAKAADMQFPLVEIFGWMIVVAIASTALRFSTFRDLASPRGELYYIIASSLVAGMIYALLRDKRAPYLRWRLGVAAALLLAFLAVLNLAIINQNMATSMNWAFGYFAAWILLDWLSQQVSLSLKLVTGDHADAGDESSPTTAFEASVEENSAV